MLRKHCSILKNDYVPQLVKIRKKKLKFIIRTAPARGSQVLKSCCAQEHTRKIANFGRL